MDVLASPAVIAGHSLAEEGLARNSPPKALRSTIVIPARLASTRLPRKLLLRETGQPLIQHTYAAASRATRPAALVVAADCEEIAAVVLFFLSADAGFITGQTLYVCGGLTIGATPE